MKVDNSKISSEKLLSSLNGIWTQKADSLSQLTINNDKWNFDEDKICYKASVTKNLEQFKSKLGFIILVRENDTLYWEFVEKSKNEINFIRFPSGNKLTYYRNR
jgi:hypothetical protein